MTKVWGTFVLVKSIPVTHLLIWAKLFGPQIFLDQKFSLVQCFFGPKIILYQKCYFHIKGFQTHNFLDTKIFFGQKFLWTDFSYNKQNNTIFLGLTQLKLIYFLLNFCSGAEIWTIYTFTLKNDHSGDSSSHWTSDLIFIFLESREHE